MHSLANNRVTPTVSDAIVVDKEIVKLKSTESLMQVSYNCIVDDIGTYKKMVWVLESFLIELSNEILIHPNNIVINSDVDRVDV